MSDRITDRDLNTEVENVTNLMREVGIIKPDTTLTLHVGSNGETKYNNYLLIGKTNQWPNGVGGRSKREAFTALRHMAIALSLVVETGQDGPIA